MRIKTDTRTLAALWAALRDQETRPKPAEVKHHVAAIAERGWVPSYRLEDLLFAMGASFFWAEFDIHALFGMKKQSIYSRPKAGAGYAMGFEETEAYDVAAMLILIERLGLGIDPSPLVEVLRPPLLKRKVLTGSELLVFWHPKERHKAEAMRVEAVAASSPVTTEAVKLPTGYKASIWCQPHEQVSSLLITAPKYRRPSKNSLWR